MNDYTLILIQSPPTPDLEALDVALALAAFDQKVILLFIGAGCVWLNNDQHARSVGSKSPSKVLAALPMYDCNDLYYLPEIASEYQYNPLATPLSAEKCQQLVAQSQHCLSF